MNRKTRTALRSIALDASAAGTPRYPWLLALDGTLTATNGQMLLRARDESFDGVSALVDPETTAELDDNISGFPDFSQLMAEAKQGPCELFFEEAKGLKALVQGSLARRKKGHAHATLTVDTKRCIITYRDVHPSNGVVERELLLPEMTPGASVQVLMSAALVAKALSGVASSSPVTLVIGGGYSPVYLVAHDGKGEPLLEALVMPRRQ